MSLVIYDRQYRVQPILPIYHNEFGDINNYRQNHPELIVRDLKGMVDEQYLRSILKYRGVNKWLRIRRLLIQLKTRWLDIIKSVHIARRLHKEEGNEATAMYLKGYEAAMTNCRQQIRALCHSPRDIDFPASISSFGEICDLPKDFPLMPHKKWFHKVNKPNIGIGLNMDMKA